MSVSLVPKMAPESKEITTTGSGRRRPPLSEHARLLKKPKQKRLKAERARKAAMASDNALAEPVADPVVSAMANLVRNQMDPATANQAGSLTQSVTVAQLPFLTEQEIKDRTAKAVALDRMISETFYVRPDDAKSILDRLNTKNRQINLRKVKRYADDMMADQWGLNSQGLSFDTQGLLNNGQHRLSAIVKSGKTFPIYATFGEQEDAFEDIDQGNLRSVADTLGIIFKHSNPKDVTKVARTILASGDTPARGKKDFEVADLVPIWHKFQHHPIDDSLRIGKRIRRALSKHLSVQGIQAAHWAILNQSPCATKIGSYNNQRMTKVEEFFNGILDGSNLQSTDARFVLREMIRKHDKKMQTDNVGVLYTNDKHSQPVETMAYFVLAWNAFIRNQLVTKPFRWDFENGKLYPKECFPNIA